MFDLCDKAGAMFALHVVFNRGEQVNMMPHSIPSFRHVSRCSRGFMGHAPYLRNDLRLQAKIPKA